MGNGRFVESKFRNMERPKGRAKRIDHLGIVATAIKQLGIIEFFDKKIPKLSQHKVSVGQVVAAMILIGLGYVQRVLYITPQFLRGWCLERLIGPGVTWAGTMAKLRRTLTTISSGEHWTQFLKLGLPNSFWSWCSPFFH